MFLIPESPRLLHRVFLQTRECSRIAYTYSTHANGSRYTDPISKLAAKSRGSSAWNRLRSARPGSSSELRDVEWRPCSRPFPRPHGLFVLIKNLPGFACMLLEWHALLFSKAKCTDKIDVPQRGRTIYFEMNHPPATVFAYTYTYME